jgi:D-alanyl-D-alanine carboxypeptidase/D-alanyl-D-alanine-endopeptidase (penicillin-binding protein 4)
MNIKSYYSCDTTLLSFLLFFSFIFSTGCKNEPEVITVELSPGKSETGPVKIIKKLRKGSSIGYILYDPETEKVLASRNSELLFMPASVTKVVTATAALSILGPDYRFKTELLYSGKMEKGQIEGDLYLKGGGDPLLKVDHLMLMIEKMAESGIKRITGKFCYDDTSLARSEMIDRGMDEDASYNTGFSSLSLWFNVNFFRWETEKDKEKEKINCYLVPELPMYQPGTFESDDKKNRRFRYKGTPDRGQWLMPLHITERKPKGRKRIPVKNPSLYTALMFRKLCSLYNIELPPPERGRAPESQRELYTHESISLQSLSEVVLTYSNNMMAELLNVTAAGNLAGKTVGLRDSGRVISDYLKEKIRGINWKGFLLVNGSGLTSRNRISPAQMLGVLLLADSLKFDEREYMTLLPVSGWKGSLQKRLDKPGTAFRVWAKTGAINYTSSLAGYLFTQSGRKLLFSLFISDFDKRDALDQEGNIRLKKKAEAGAYWWSRDTGKIIDSMVTHWINKY